MHMFKRGSAQPQKEQRRIGQPQLLHTTYNQDNLIPKHTGLVASNAPSEYFETPLAALPLPLPHNSSTHRRLDDSLDSGSFFQPGHQRNVSSVHSQPSQDGQMSDTNSAYSQSSQVRFEPLKSNSVPRPTSRMPTTRPLEAAGSRDDDQSKGGPRPSHIPTLRRPPGAAAETRWDEYTGAPIWNGTGGKPGQVQPGTFKQMLNKNTSSAQPNYNVTISGGQQDRPKKPTWSERAARIRKDAFDARPPWKGGSGRHALVDPVNDTTVARSSPKYTAVKDFSRAGLQDGESDSSIGMASVQSAEPPNLSPVSSLEDHFDQSVETDLRNDSVSSVDVKHVSPILISVNGASAISQGKDQSSPTRLVQTRDSVSPAPTRISRKPVAKPVSDKESRMPSGQGEAKSHFSWTTYADSNADDRSLSTDVPTVPDMPNESVSRFSWTTVNTTTTYQQDSPPPSPPSVPVPSVDMKAWRNFSSPPKVPDKVLTPPPVDDEKKPHAKALPQAPTVSKTMNHIELLTAQESDLVLRKRNVNKVIRELQQVESASPLDVDWKTAKANKKKLEERQAQLSEIEREQHEIGLAIARARRKAEREEGIDSGLWVRRVTG